MFRLCYAFAQSHSHDVYVLSQAVRDELLCASVWLLLAETDLRAPVNDFLWALDASPSGGAFVRTPIHREQAKELYRFAEKLGGYSKLEPRARCLLRELGEVTGDIEELQDMDLSTCFPL